MPVAASKSLRSSSSDSRAARRAFPSRLTPDDDVDKRDLSLLLASNSGDPNPHHQPHPHPHPAPAGFWTGTETRTFLPFGDRGGFKGDSTQRWDGLGPEGYAPVQGGGGVVTLARAALLPGACPVRASRRNMEK